ncbi:hypothetical protein [Agrococcus baldri]|uniref:Uncharacterized protein n=1 Tax=Agrococcus baldri TaxID=153730 RepID=A0AA87USE2_9MICO|nr:hypothetical protein [Agrococcus baldri]GEK80579.1 hypothetical protein ABA31_19300 [Agrococcus baldri]
MTITKDTPVAPSAESFRDLEQAIESGHVTLTRTMPPRWADEWLDKPAYHRATPDERYVLMVDALERQRLAREIDPTAGNLNRKETP